MGWTALFAAVRGPTGWSVEMLDREESVDDLAYQLSEYHGAVVICFVLDSEVAYAVAEADDGTRARLVFNEEQALEHGMDFLPTGRAEAAATELAAWSLAHAPRPVSVEDARRVLTAGRATAEEGVAELFELLGLPWPWDDPRA